MALFVVVLVVTLLTTVGIFAARSASQVAVAAGHSREATQTFYFAELATALGVRQLNGPQASEYINLTQTSVDECQVNAAIQGDPNAHCYRIFSDDITTGTGLTIMQTQGVNQPGSFGPPLLQPDTLDDNVLNTGREGLFVVEMVEGYDDGTPVAGFDASTVKMITLNLTAYAQIRTTPNVAPSTRWCGSPDSARSATIMAERAYVTVPLL